MFVTNHVLAGSLVGLALPANPAQSFFGGVASHVIMDLTPHCGDGTLTDDEFFLVARRDGLVALGVLAAVMLATPKPRRAVMAGVLGAVLLDLDKPCKRFFGIDPFPRAVSRLHHWIQNEAPHRIPHEFGAGGVLAVTAVGGLIGRRWKSRQSRLSKSGHAQRARVA